jgi:hypothetical protein
MCNPCSTRVYKFVCWHSVVVLCCLADRRVWVNSDKRKQIMNKVIN